MENSSSHNLFRVDDITIKVSDFAKAQEIILDDNIFLDLILTDIQLPQVKGGELLKLTRENRAETGALHRSRYLARRSRSRKKRHTRGRVECASRLFHAILRLRDRRRIAAGHGRNWLHRRKRYALHRHTRPDQKQTGASPPAAFLPLR